VNGLMPSVRRAVIDIGTNSVKLLVAEVSGRGVVPLLEQSEQTRLGEGFYAAHVLQPAAIARTARAVAKFAAAAGALKSESVRVVGTSAARDAINPAELCGAIEAAAGLPLEVISGEEEARWAFAGVTSDPALAALPLLLLDVGGGSTEFIVGQADVQHYRQSFHLGTVRMLEQYPLSDPPTAAEWSDCAGRLRGFFRDEVAPRLRPALAHFPPRTVRLVGTGGTTTILARIKLESASFDRACIEAVHLSRTDVEGQRERLWTLPLARRREIVGLPPNRADVILMGVAIFSGLMNEFDFDELRVSTRGLRFAAVMNAP